jgi:hypothetical protein
LYAHALFFEVRCCKKLAREASVKISLIGVCFLGFAGFVSVEAAADSIFKGTVLEGPANPVYARAKYIDEA